MRKQLKIIHENEIKTNIQIKSFNSFNLEHTDPPAARAVRSSSNRSPIFPAFVRVSLINDDPPEVHS